MYDNVNSSGVRDPALESYLPHITRIKDIKFGAKNINLNAIVLFLGKAVVTKSGQTVCTCRIADSSGSIDLSLWDNLSKLLKPGDIISVFGAYAIGFKGRLSLNVGRGGNIEKCGEFCFLFEDQPCISDMPLDGSVLHQTVKGSVATPTPSHSGSTNNKYLVQKNNAAPSNETAIDPRKSSANLGASYKNSTPSSTVTTNNNINKFRHNYSSNFSTSNTNNSGNSGLSPRPVSSSKNYGFSAVPSNAMASSATSVGTNFSPKGTNSASGGYTDNKFIPKDPRLKNL